MPLLLYQTMHDRLAGRSPLGAEPPSSPETPMAMSWRPTLRGLDAVSASALNPIKGLAP